MAIKRRVSISKSTTCNDAGRSTREVIFLRRSLVSFRRSVSVRQRSSTFSFRRERSNCPRPASSPLRTLVLMACMVAIFWKGGLTAEAREVQRPDRTKSQMADGTDLATTYRATADRIIDAALAGNDAWRKLEELCDGIGHRLSGSESLERAIDWAVNTLRRDGQENVRREKVMVPHWVRGEESLTLLSPKRVAIPILGLGGSVATPLVGITADVVVVADKQQLDALPDDQVRGRIVLFNNAMPPYDPQKGTGYGQAVAYRSQGASWAAARGAVACLIRSVTANSLRSPHTGAMHYDPAHPKIPAAAVSIEDAMMFDRLFKRGETVTVNLKMEARMLPDAESANVIAELRGREKPEEIVVIGGHIDSWDVGQGASDDGGGVVICMEAINVLRKLDLRPRRTIRVVLFTNEENGLAGGRQYAADYAAELSRHVAAIESDGGVFAPVGFGVTVKPPLDQALAVRQLGQITSLLARVGATRATDGGGGADIGPMAPAGVPQLAHHADMSRYFDYHHSEADTLDKIKPEELSQNVAAMAVAAYIIADMPGRLGDKGP